MGLALGLVGCLAMLAACDYTSSAKAQDLCTRYDQLADSVNAFLDERPVSAKADELRTRSQEITAELDEFQAVSEGRLDTAISAVRAELAAIKESTVKAGAEARAAVRPQVEESLSNLADAWAVMEDVADRQCGSDT